MTEDAPAVAPAIDLPQNMDDYIKESIETSLGLQISAHNLTLKFLASEDARRRLQDQIFVLEERFKDSDARIDKFRMEASMNAQALRKCIEEKEMVASAYDELVARCRKLDQECALYEGDLRRVMESCDELGKENEELRAMLNDKSDHLALAAEIESLKNDKEHLRINLHRAEEEVKVLFIENKLLDEENKTLFELLKRERQLHGSEGRQSVSASAKGKRKSCLKDSSPTRVIEFNTANSILLHNSPDSRMQKK